MNQTTSSHTTELNGEATNGAPVSIHAQRPGVTRISRRALMLTAVFGASLGLVVLMTGFGGPPAQLKRFAICLPTTPLTCVMRQRELATER